MNGGIYRPPLLLLFVLLGASGGARTDELSAEERAWLETDDDTSQVSEGELRFLPHPPSPPVHHIHNRFTIDTASLQRGWVALRQCHEHLDAVPASQIVYRYHAMRGLRIVSTRHIAKTWIENRSVQMQQVEHDAALCIEAEVNILREDRDGHYTLSSGPYHRKFLDGYYPMRVTIELAYPAEEVELTAITPPPQTGVKLTRQHGWLRLDSVFEGRLTIQLEFER